MYEAGEGADCESHNLQVLPDGAGHPVDIKRRALGVHGISTRRTEIAAIPRGGTGRNFAAR